MCVKKYLKVSTTITRHSVKNIAEYSFEEIISLKENMKKELMMVAEEEWEKNVEYLIFDLRDDR